MITYLLALTLWLGIPPQVTVTSDAQLTPDQRALLPLVELLQVAILQNDRTRLINMFESSSARLSPQQVAQIREFLEHIDDPANLFSCVLFDTSCARGHLTKTNSRVSGLFISVREFFQKHRNELQVAFHEMPGGALQAELHVPRRPDSSTVPPPFGTYESVTFGFVKVGAEWKINVLAPEAYAIALQ